MVGLKMSCQNENSKKVYIFYLKKFKVAFVLDKLCCVINNMSETFRMV